MSGWGQVKCEKARLIGGFRCESCGRELTRRTVIGHHITYRRHGGRDVIENCLLRCSTCEHSDPHSNRRTDDGRRKKNQKRQRVALHNEQTARPSELDKVQVHTERTADDNLLAIIDQFRQLLEGTLRQEERLTRIERLLFPS